MGGRHSSDLWLSGLINFDFVSSELNEALKTEYGSVYYLEYVEYAVPFTSMISYE